MERESDGRRETEVVPGVGLRRLLYMKRVYTISKAKKKKEELVEEERGVKMVQRGGRLLSQVRGNKG